MSELRDVTEALVAIDDTLDVQKQSIHNLESRLNEFENVTLEAIKADQRFIKNYLILLQDQMIEGFKRLGAPISKKDVGPDGRY